MNVNDINKILGTFISPDIARLAMPRQEVIENLTIGNDIVAKYNSITRHLKDSVEAQHKYASEVASNLMSIAQALEQQYRPQINAFQSITQRLQPLILQQTQSGRLFSNGSIQTSPLIDAMTTISSVNGFQIYLDVFEEFGGAINPVNVTDEEIENAIKEHQGLIHEVNEVVLKAESDGASPGNIHEIIYQFLVKKIPKLNKRTYGIIILIFTVIQFAYNIYSNNATDEKIDENKTTLNEKVVPKLEENEATLKVQSDELTKVKDETTKISKEVDNVDAKVDSINSGLNELHGDFEKHQKETESKLDLILDEMRKQQNKTQK